MFQLRGQTHRRAIITQAHGALCDEVWPYRGPPAHLLQIPDRFLFVPSFTHKNVPEIKEIKLDKNDLTPHLYVIFSKSFLL